MRPPRKIVLVAAVALLAAVTAGCSSGRDALTIYSGRDEALIGPLLERFNEETGIPIDVRYGDSAELALLIEQEGEGSPADVFISQSPGAVGYLADKDMLATLPEKILQRVSTDFEQSSGHWVGLTARQRVLVYNTELVSEDELPSSVLDLTDPAYEGKVAIAPPNGSFQDFVTAMRQMEGDDVAQEWLDGMAANDAPTFPDNNSIVDAVARGEVPMGLVNHYYNVRYLTEDPSAPSRNYQFPGDDVGSVVLATTTSILEASDRAEEAQRFVEFLLSEESQEYFAEVTFEYPLAEGVEPSDALPPLESLAHPDYDIQRLGEGLTRTVEMIRSSGLL
ncbi:MAG: iron ABC transporter substrate-binding protein [Actinomycetota bacterium]